ncbi:MarR family winged helix-turn-helix transcriptional regulator [Thermoflavimicrobium dichotomicum]|uniref:DNA-binding transcriptional regulator, MarR family n=1 Tax=Thermoflavimicrobium dichotomicum TaxID=46223 RepID=A0A1I3KIF7_9BACL|nr:MarR family transcriptional regulator [Thermoflavimicrobium dichotomicum]SFI72266.1 DNA-binding transcriptional regulator, MarR family [Thermoflavimicrobium dichotomicum]
MIEDRQINHLLTLFKQMIRQLHHIAREELKELNITMPQAQVIRVLREEGPQSLVELSKKLESSTSSLSGIVDRLEKEGLVSRERDQKDRRVVWISLTPKCKELIKKIPDTQAQYIRKYVEKMSEEDVILLIEKMEIFVKVLKEETESKEKK